MMIDPQAAADALRTVEQTENRARTLRGYRAASWSFLIWGAAWFIANGLCELLPQRIGTIWLSVDAIAIAACIVVSWRYNKSEWRTSLRWLAGFGALFVLVAGIFAILPPASGEQITAIISLTIAFKLTLVGLFALGARYVVLGLVLSAAIMGGYLLLPAYQFLWFGLVGGGAVALAGLWMRRA